MVDRRGLEGLAEHVLSERGMDDPPVDGYDLAEALMLRACWTSGSTSRLNGKIIELGTGLPFPRIHYALTHECAHYVLKVLGPVNDEPHARYLGAALLVPRRALLRALRAGWDLEQLRCVHVNASAELLARRIVEVRREGSMAIYDNGRFRYRFGLDAHEREHELAREALERGKPVRLDDRTGAWPVFGDQVQRVVVLSAA